MDNDTAAGGRFIRHSARISIKQLFFILFVDEFIHILFYFIMYKSAIRILTIYYFLFTWCILLSTRVTI